tara:strand:+ start:2592 stop:2759 length:168 start_codon:yes stop_codon:yes gene_type:complete
MGVTRTYLMLSFVIHNASQISSKALRTYYIIFIWPRACCADLCGLKRRLFLAGNI